MALAKLDCAVGEIVDDEPAAPDWSAVVFERWIEVFAPVALSEPVELIEAARVRMVGPLAAVVPLAETGGGVARGAESFGDGAFVGVEAFLAGAHTGDAAPQMPAAGEEFSAGGRANGLDEQAVERHAVTR